MSLSTQLADEAKVLEPRDIYDEAIVGVTRDGFAIYSVEKVIEAGTKIYESYEESSEWHYYNTFDAYVGEGTPIFMWEIDDD